jgi:hypothetical protein
MQQQILQQLRAEMAGGRRFPQAADAPFEGARAAAPATAVQEHQEEVDAMSVDDQLSSCSKGSGVWPIYWWKVHRKPNPSLSCLC